MKRLLIVTVAIVALGVPLAASGRVVQLGEAEPALPSSTCPEDPCLALYQATGYQESAENSKERPYVVRRDGKVLAFTVKLGKLTREQIGFFDGKFGTPASARISILSRGKKRGKRNQHRLLARSEVFSLRRYFGSSATFVLEEPLAVERGNVVAITVPTWAPILAGEQEKATEWRSSRRRGRCGTSERLAPPAPQGLGSVARWGCNYSEARLLYTATYVPNNVPTRADDEGEGDGEEPGRRRR